MLRLKKRWLLGLLLCSAMAALSQTQDKSVGTSQSNAPSPPKIKATSDNEENHGWLEPGADPENKLVTPFLKHLAFDQKEFWSSPIRFRTKDLKWIVPSAGITAAFIASDSWFSKQVPDKTGQLNRSLNISDYGLYSMIGVGGGAFLVGHITKNDHLQEVGLLSGEAAINSTGVTYLLKVVTQRQLSLIHI